MGCCDCYANGFLMGGMVVAGGILVLGFLQRYKRMLEEAPVAYQGEV